MYNMGIDYFNEYTEPAVIMDTMRNIVLVRIWYPCMIRFLLIIRGNAMITYKI